LGLFKHACGEEIVVAVWGRLMSAARHKRLQPTFATVAIATSVSLGVLIARHLSLLQGLELALFDHHVEWLPTRDGATTRISVVEVTESDIQELGKYPISDGDLARALEILIASGARGIGIDIYRDIPAPPGTERLGAVFAGSPNVIVPTKFADEGAHGVAPPAALAGTGQVGFTNLVIDPDGSVRRALLYMEDAQGEVGVAMSLSLATLFLHEEGILPAPNAERPEVIELGAGRLEPLNSTFGGYVDVDTGGYQHPFEFHGSREPLPGTDLSTLLAGDADPALFRDRMVMIGVTAVSLTDDFRTPLRRGINAGETIPGVEIHGRIADQLVGEALGELRPLRELPDWLEVALILLTGMVGAALMLRIRTVWALALTALLGLFGLWSLGLVSLLWGYWTPVFAPTIAWSASLFVVVAYAKGRERAERVELMRLFSRHVTEQVARDVWRHRDEFLEGGRPKPVRLTATIVFVDIKGYSESAEKMDPAELMGWMDRFLGAMAQEVLDRGGFVEDYFGDGLMACFGIPIPGTDADHVRTEADCGVEAALAMRRSLGRLNADRDAEGLAPIGIRIGMCTGVVVAGSMGSSSRLKYAVVGDSVVTAQRLESIALDRVPHDFTADPARILLSESTLSHIGPAFQTEPVGDFLVKGKEEPVTVHRLTDRSDSHRAELQEDSR
jgi:adenylate cyclase